MRALWMVVAIGCGSTPVQGTRGPPSNVIDTGIRDRGVAALVAANGDARALAARFVTPLGFGGMWFPDPQCRARFGSVGMIDAVHIADFAGCVAQVTLARDAREAALPDVGTLTYGPQIELEVLFEASASRVKWLGYVSQQRPDDTQPTVLGQALETTRADPPDAAAGTRLRAMLDSDLAAHPTLKHAFSWLKVCIDETGAVRSVRARTASTRVARDVFTARALRWRFQPFLLGGEPAPVCAMVFAVYPSAQLAREVLPHPIPPTHADVTMFAPAGLPKRIAGAEVSVDRVVRLLAAAQRDGFDASFLFCIDTSGTPVDVKVLRTTGIVQIDATIMTSLRDARYEPPPAKTCTLERRSLWLPSR